MSQSERVSLGGYSLWEGCGMKFLVKDLFRVMAVSSKHPDTRVRIRGRLIGRESSAPFHTERPDTSQSI